MKKLLSIMIIIAMLMCACFSVSAGEVNDSDAELSKAVEAFKSKVAHERRDIEPDVQGLRYFPFYSEGTTERCCVLYDEIDNCDFNSFEVLETEQAKFDEYLRTKCVASIELKDMLTMFEYENNFNNYYDDQTWAEFTLVYNEARAAYENQSEEEIHIAYIKCRNMFNKLCLYNTTFGDVNHDGVFSIIDVTYIQKALADLNPNLNISQICVLVNYITCSAERPLIPNLTPTIITATSMQKYIADLNTDTSLFDTTISDIIKYGGESQFELYPADRTIDVFDYNSNEVFNMYLNQVYISQMYPNA